MESIHKIENDIDYAKEIALLIRRRLNIHHLRDIDIYDVANALGMELVNNDDLGLQSMLNPSQEENKVTLYVNKEYRNNRTHRQHVAYHIGIFLFYTRHDTIYGKNQSVNEKMILKGNWEQMIYFFAAYLLINQNTLIPMWQESTQDEQAIKEISDAFNVPQSEVKMMLNLKKKRNLFPNNLAFI